MGIGDWAQSPIPMEINNYFNNYIIMLIYILIILFKYIVKNNIIYLFS